MELPNAMAHKLIPWAHKPPTVNPSMKESRAKINQPLHSVGLIWFRKPSKKELTTDYSCLIVSYFFHLFSIVLFYTILSKGLV